MVLSSSHHCYLAMCLYQEKSLNFFSFHHLEEEEKNEKMKLEEQIKRPLKDDKTFK